MFESRFLNQTPFPVVATLYCVLLEREYRKHQEYNGSKSNTEREFHAHINIACCRIWVSGKPS